MESMSTLLSRWRQASAKMKKLTADTPRIIGNECMKVVKDNFRLQGYDSGNGVKPWEKRKPATDKAYDRGKTTNSKGKQSRYRTGKNKTYKGSVYSSQNPILEQTRSLVNSIKYGVINKTVTIGILTDKKSKTGAPIFKYAEHLNEGGNGTPARKFMPDPDQSPNPKMLKRIKKKIQNERGTAMKDFTLR